MIAWYCHNRRHVVSERHIHGLYVHIRYIMWTPCASAWCYSVLFWSIQSQCWKLDERNAFVQGDGACRIKLDCDSLNYVILLWLVSRELYLLPVLRPLKGITFIKRPNDGGMSFQRTKLTLSFIHCFQSSSKISTPKKSFDHPHNK